MATATTFTKSGTKATTAAKLSKDVFDVLPKDHTLLKEVYVAYLANGRQNLAVAKKRGEVSGGGRKPWKQKGTGRARFGSTRNPIWTGGGVAFGPTGEENYTKKVNLKAKRLALRQALSLKASDKKLFVLEDLQVKTGKTSELVALLEKIGAGKKVLLAVENKTAELVRASNNLENVKLIQASYLNVYDILNSDTVILTSKSLAEVTAWLEGGKK